MWLHSPFALRLGQGAAKAPAPPATKGFNSPEEAWAAWAAARDAGIGEKALNCLTPAALAEMAGGLTLDLWFCMGWFNLREAHTAEFQALVKQSDEFFHVNGFDPKQLERQCEADPDGDREELVQLCSRSVKDKRRCVREARVLLAKMQAMVTRETRTWEVEAAKPGNKDKPGVRAYLNRGKLANVKVYRESATGQTEQPNGLDIARTEQHFFRRIDGRWYVGAENGEPVHATTYKIGRSQIPCERKLRIVPGDAATFELPDGKQVAVWCMNGRWWTGGRWWAGEETTASGLKTNWGEKPYTRLPLEAEQERDRPAARRRVGSYVKFAGVTTAAGETATYHLLVDQWQLDIIEDLQAENTLPVTIRIAKCAILARPMAPCARSSLALRIESGNVCRSAGDGDRWGPSDHA